MKKLVSLPIVLVMLLSTGCVLNFSGFNWDDFNYSFMDEQQHATAGINAIEFNVTNGAINVLPAAEGVEEIILEIDERIKAKSEEKAEEIADKVQLKATTRGDRLVFEVDYGGEKRLKKYWACKIDVIVPARMALTMETTNGSLKITGLEGLVKAESTNGSITVDDCLSAVSLHTTNGSIKATGIENTVKASTTNGNINIEAEYTVEASTTNGNIGVSILTELRGDIDLSTTNGRIKCSLPSDSSFELNSGTTNGHIDVDINGDFDSNKRRTRVTGSVGDGRYQVVLRTTNGSITLTD